MLRSGENIWSEALEFVANSDQITLYSAYIKVDVLARLNVEKKINRIVVRWELRDLHQGASDPELYEYCKANNIALFRNTRIHLKCMSNEKGEVLLGSANISQRGINSLGDNYNYELNSFNQDLKFADELYLNRILAKSEYVTEELFLKIKHSLSALEDYKQDDVYSHIEVESIKTKADYFLISELPMFFDASELYNGSQNIESLSILDRKCIIHDLATYGISSELEHEEFYIELKAIFNNHPFIIALKEQIINDRRQSMGYGAVVRWITEHTTSVPTPISWELKEKQVVNILYEWITFFDQDFTVETPRHSQVIFYRKNKQT
jgi:hypothetical protein